MENNKALVVSGDDLKVMLNLADVFAKSGRFTGEQNAAQALVKIQAGRELSISPVMAMTNIHIVNGRVTLGAGVISSLIKRSGKYDYKVIKLDDDGCILEFYQNGELMGETPELSRSSFLKSDAEKAGLLGKDVWRKFPRNMYFSRAISNGARWFAGDVFGGSIYTPEELGDDSVSVEVETKEWNPSFQEFLNKAQIEIDPSLTKEKVVDYLRDNGFSWTTDAKPKMWLALQEKFSKSDNITEAEIA